MSDPDTAAGVLAELRSRNLLPLLEHVCDLRGVVAGDVCGRGRTRSVTLARQELWWAIRHHPQRCHSLTEIARFFRRDPTTISHGVASHSRRHAP